MSAALSPPELNRFDAAVLRALEELDGFTPGGYFTPRQICTRAGLNVRRTTYKQWGRINGLGLADMAGSMRASAYVGIPDTDTWSITGLGREALAAHRAERAAAEKLRSATR